LIKSGYEILKLSISCTRFEVIIVVLHTCRSSENICSSSDGAQEKEKRDQNRMKLSLAPKKKGAFFSVSPSVEG
jgi:hypothetical protein